MGLTNLKLMVPFCRTLTDALIRRIMVGLNGTCGRDVVQSAADRSARRGHVPCDAPAP